MDREALRALLIDLIEQEMDVRHEHLADETNLRELGIDSVDMIALVMQVENRLAVRIDSTELLSLVTVCDLLNLLERKRDGGSTSVAA